MNVGTRWASPIAAIILALSMFACGASQQSADEEAMNIQAFSMTARLEYRIDSLINENRRIVQQLDALAAENRILSARNQGLESQPKETPAPQSPLPQQSQLLPAEANAPVTDVTSGYPQALNDYKKRNFPNAIAEFEGLLLGNIQEDLADNCQYWIGECNYAMGKYSEAIYHFEMVLGYRRSEKKDDSQMMIGNSYAAMGKKTEARDAYQKLLSEYPASVYAKKAQEKLAQF
jgi:TolA-binding protein